MRQYFVGVDVSKGRHTAAVVDDAGQLWIKPFAFDDDRAGYASLLAAVNGLPGAGPICVCLEATGNYGHRLGEYLRGQQGWVVSMVNPRQSHHFAQVLMMRTKTDRVDAVTLARYAQAMRPRAMVQGAYAHLARLTRSRDTLQASLVAQANQLRSLLEGINPAVERAFADPACATALAVLDRYPTGAKLAAARLDAVAGIKITTRRLGPVRARRLLGLGRSLPGEQGTPSDAVLIRQLVAAIRQLQQCMARLEQEIAALVKGHLLFSHPALGQHTVPVALAELPIDQLDTDTQAVAFAGLNPRKHESGRFAGKVKLSKTGPPSLRRTLYMAAMASLRLDPVMAAYYQRKRAEGKTGKAALVACMSKLLRIIFALLKTGRPYDPNHQTNRLRRPTMAAQCA